MDVAARRGREIRKVLLLTLGLNLLVAGLKVAYGTLTNTLALRADGFHSLTDGANNVLGLVAQLAGRLDAGLKLSSPTRTGDAGAAAGAQQAGVPRTTRLPMRVAVLYGKALDMADKGDKARAVELFSAVLKEFPDYAPARTGMAKVNPGK